MTQSIQSLSSLVVSQKTTVVDYPGCPDFKININFLSRETLQKLRKKATSVSYKNRQPVETVDDEMFLKLYADACITGWTGLKMKYLENLIPIDESKIEDLDQELEYTPDNALLLMKGSVTFDQFISEIVTDLGNFTKNK